MNNTPDPRVHLHRDEPDCGLVTCYWHLRQRVAEARERAERWDGRTHCGIGCTHFATSEHVEAHALSFGMAGWPR